MDKRIGAQLFTVREYTKTWEDFEKTLKQVADIGYKTVQLSGIGPFKAEDIKNACDKYQLLPICTHRAWNEYCNQLDESIAFHKTIGCSIAGLGAMPNLRGSFTMDDIVSFVKKMNEIYERFQEHNISFAYHNHDVEFIKFDGKWVMDYLIEHGKFDFIVDVYWLAHAGVDPARFISRLGERAKVVHFKDLKIVKTDKTHEMAEVMEGNLDWDSIIEASQKAGVQWAVVEQDVCQRNPFESLKISYDNLTLKGFY